MAIYPTDSPHVKSGSGGAFDNTHKPGSIVPFSGIYRCDNCGHEDACNKGDPFPSQNHKQHSPSCGTIAWRLLVFAQWKD